MKCSECGHGNRTGAKFCEECGAQLAAVCTSCGAKLSPGAKFCSECGHPAGRTAPRTSPSSRFGTPEAYTPKYLAEQILTSKAALEGERKQVTALFADVKSSMELFSERDPEEARRLLDPVIEHMMDAVHRYEGTVNHVLGDGIVALFGAPLAHEDHAVRACYAALRMQETVKRYAEGVLRSEGIPIQIRVGLNSGEVVVRSIGSDLRMDYSVVGQTTNVAARMEQMAVPGSILSSADTLALAEGYVQVKPLGPLKVKGLDSPLEVYEVTGASTVRSRLHAAAARGLTRFVGRGRELDQLQQALERARNGQGQIVAVVGEPGVGKSRLYWEFTRSHRTEGWLIVESSSVSYGKATGFLPIVDLLRAYFQVETGEDGRKVREKLTGRMLSLDRALDSSLSPLLWLLDAPIDDPQWQRLDPPQRRQRALEGVKRLLLRESQEQPLLVLFEDLHWIDAETQALLDALVESLPTARLLLLVNYRPEYQHCWSGKTYYQQIRIDPLPPESADELLEDLLGNDINLQPLKRLLVERTEGNPFRNYLVDKPQRLAYIYRPNGSEPLAMSTFAELSKLNEDEAREYLERIRWPSGPVCPHCGVVDNATKFKAGGKARPGVWKCKACRKQFTVTVNTIFERSHIELRLWLMAFAIMCASKKGVSALQLQRQLGLGSYQSAWHMARRIRHAMSQEPLNGMLAGRVEVDETYVGGKPRPGNNEPRKRGRGTKKTPVVALVERDGKARAFPIERVNAATLKGTVRENVDRSAMILTDEWASYRGLAKEFEGGHFTVNHGKGEYARDGASTNTVESYFALLKRGVYGSFHHVSKRHLHRYCDEFSFRWNLRRVTDGERTDAALRASEGKRLTYRKPIS